MEDKKNIQLAPMKLTYILLIAIIKQLTFGDFTGMPDPVLVQQGITGQLCDQWTLNDSTNDGRVYFTLSWDIVHEKSWVTNHDPRLLDHEQCHQNISLLWYNKFEKILYQYQGCSERQKKKVVDLFNYYWKESRNLQKLFDKESKHGANQVIENIYEHRIERDLK